MERGPSIVFVPGAWHKPQCYHKIIKSLENEHDLKCVPTTLPSTSGDREATFKDDIDVVRNAIMKEMEAGHNVIVVAHSYGGMVGNSAIKGLTQLRSATPNSDTGCVVALVLIASGFTITGLSFMDPFFGIPPPFWRINKETGSAELTANERELFYHDLPQEEGEHWVNQLTTQSLKALFEGGEHAYAGWKHVPTWYVGTTEDRGLPVIVQRIQVGAARVQGGIVHHVELPTSHSPFLSMPEEVVAVILDAVAHSRGLRDQGLRSGIDLGVYSPEARLFSPRTWLQFGVPLAIGHFLGWVFAGYHGLKSLFAG